MTANTLAGPEAPACWTPSNDQELHFEWTKTRGPDTGYITRANARGASYFDMGSTGDTLSAAERTAANNHFLDVIAARGDRVLLSTPKMQLRGGTALADEITYLTE